MTKEEILKKQLKLSMSALEQYAKPENWRSIYPHEADFAPSEREIKWKKEKGYELAQKKLQQIKDLGR